MNTHNKQRSYNNNAKRIDFATLSTKELEKLSQDWLREAMTFEIRFDAYYHGNKEIPKKTDDLNAVANRLWRRLRALERWRINNGSRKQF